MKASLIAPSMRLNPLYREDAAAVARLQKIHYSVPKYVECPSGTVISDPEAYMLVRMGMAQPADEECAKRCGMTEQQIELAVKAQEKVSKGIHPDDYHRYDRKEILGYKPDGTYIKGPTWDEFNQVYDYDEPDELAEVEDVETDG